MSIVYDIFDEYVDMRMNGADSKTVLRALRSYVQPIDSLDKKHLSTMIKKWENGEMEVSTAKETVSPIKPLARPSESPLHQQDAPFEAVAPPADDDMIWLSCNNCDTRSREVDVFCRNCGHLLEGINEPYATKQFKNITGGLSKSDHFSAESIMVLVARDTNIRFELSPQHHPHNPVIGRDTGNNAMMPDIDLGDFGADTGVSRLHLAVNFDPDEEQILVADLGSANGTFINGQRLLPNEGRILRDGDELRLGRCVLGVFFHHPGDAIDN